MPLFSFSNLVYGVSTVKAFVPLFSFSNLVYGVSTVKAFVPLFSFFILSDLRSLKIEHENNSTKT